MKYDSDIGDVPYIADRRALEKHERAKRAKEEAGELRDSVFRKRTVRQMLNNYRAGL